MLYRSFRSKSFSSLPLKTDSRVIVNIKILLFNYLQAERHAVVLRRGVRHGVAHLRHPCAWLLASGGPKRLRPAAPQPASVPQPGLGGPRMSPSLWLTMG